MQSFENIPVWIAEAWGIDLVVAQIFISSAVFFGFIVPILVLRKKSASGFNLELVGGFFALSVCVGLGWLPFWVLMAVIVVLAVTVAIFGSDMVLGSK